MNDIREDLSEIILSNTEMSLQTARIVLELEANQSRIINAVYDIMDGKRRKAIESLSQVNTLIKTDMTKNSNRLIEAVDRLNRNLEDLKKLV